MRGTVHHIDLTVSDLMVSAAFYETVLGFLGYQRAALLATIEFVYHRLIAAPIARLLSRLAVLRGRESLPPVED